MNQAFSRYRTPFTTAAALAAIGIVSLILTFARSDAGATTSSGSGTLPDITNVESNVESSVAVLNTTASSVVLPTVPTDVATTPSAVPCPGTSVDEEATTTPSTEQGQPVQGQGPTTPGPTSCVTITLRLPIGLESSTQQICNVLDKYHLAEILMSIGDTSDPVLTCT